MERTTILQILLGAGPASALERRKGKIWKGFLRPHWGVLGAPDFFQVAVLTLGGQQRYWVMVVMELCPRRVVSLHSLCR